jgi:hypothetical protein
MNSGKTAATATGPGRCAEQTEATPGFESWNPVSAETHRRAAYVDTDTMKRYPHFVFLFFH